MKKISLKMVERFEGDCKNHIMLAAYVYGEGIYFNKVLLTKNYLKNNVFTSTLRHELCHAMEHFNGEETDCDPINDLKTLFAERVRKTLGCTIKKAKDKADKTVDELVKIPYDRIFWRREAKAFIAGYFPEELLNPTTKTSEYLATLMPSVRIKHGKKGKIWMELSDKPHAYMIEQVLIHGKNKLDVWFEV